MDEVRSWLEILKPYISEHEVINYCVSLYYDRSMVTLTSRIIGHFREKAYWPGMTDTPENFINDLVLAGPETHNHKKLYDVNGRKLMAFAADECPMSMVEVVMNVRRAVQKKGSTVIVVPLEQLNEHHLSMTRMVSGGNMLFVDDETWRKKSFPEKVKLPLFVQIVKEQVVEIAN